MASSAALTEAAAARGLGQFLTGAEARQIADRLADGDSLTVAIRVVSAGRRPEARALLEAVDPGQGAPVIVIAVLRAVEGARSLPAAVDPIWTMPGHVAQGGPLTSRAVYLIEHARQSVTCSTYNFQRSSGLWTALREAARRPEIVVRVYLDAAAADRKPGPGTPTTTEVAAHLRPATVLRSKQFDGKPTRNHAKFLAIDHRFLLVTSANFSWSAEYGNIEFGVLHDDRNLAEAVEREIRNAEDLLFERVAPVS